MGGEERTGKGRVREKEKRMFDQQYLGSVQKGRRRKSDKDPSFKKNNGKGTRKGAEIRERAVIVIERKLIT